MLPGLLRPRAHARDDEVVGQKGHGKNGPGSASRPLIDQGLKSEVFGSFGHFSIRYMRKTSTKLTEVTIQGGQFWCVTWPKPGKGRNRQFFKDKSEAKTFLGHKLIEQENYGISGMAFNLRQRAEYLECAEKLVPFNATLRDAVTFYLPHLQATN